MRAYAIKKGLFSKKNKFHHLATVYSDDFDRKVDYGMRRWLEKREAKIFDSWLSGFVAQQVPHTLKILVYCSNDTIRVDRIVNRDGLTVNQAKKHIFERERKNTAKWRRMYKKEWQQWVIDPKTISPKKPIWFWYPKMYDLKINTFRNSKEKTLQKALKKLNFKGKVNYDKIFAQKDSS